MPGLRVQPQCSPSFLKTRMAVHMAVAELADKVWLGASGLRAREAIGGHVGESCCPTTSTGSSCAVLACWNLTRCLGFRGVFGHLSGTPRPRAFIFIFSVENVSVRVLRDVNVGALGLSGHFRHWRL